MQNTGTVPAPIPANAWSWEKRICMSIIVGECDAHDFMYFICQEGTCLGGGVRDRFESLGRLTIADNDRRHH